MQEHLSEIERKYGVRILFAADAGSKSWGWSDAKSDNDVRFIYMHDPSWYLSIDEGLKDVILYKCDSDDTNYSYDGWDIKKALKLIREGNPGILEWFNSPFIYKSDTEFVHGVKVLSEKYLSVKIMSHHHLNIALKHQRLYFTDKVHVYLKKYFYVLRPLLAVKYIKEIQKVPPIQLQELIEQLASMLPNEELSRLKILLQDKKGGNLNPNETERIEILDKWVENLLEECKSYCKEFPKHIELPPTQEYSTLCSNTILKQLSK